MRYMRRKFAFFTSKLVLWLGMPRRLAGTSEFYHIKLGISFQGLCIVTDTHLIHYATRPFITEYPYKVAADVVVIVALPVAFEACFSKQSSLLVSYQLSCFVNGLRGSFIHDPHRMIKAVYHC